MGLAQRAHEQGRALLNRQLHQNNRVQPINPQNRVRAAIMQIVELQRYHAR